MYLLSTKANKVYTDVKYTGDSYLVFGPETRGIPEDYILEKFDKTVRIPMRKRYVRLIYQIVLQLLHMKLKDK